MKKGVLIVALVVTSFLAGVCIVAFLSSLSPRHSQTATEEWVFEKYFEDRGNGIYHVEGRDWSQWVSPFPDTKPEPDDPTKVRTTQDVATVLGEWQRRHYRRIVAFHLDSQDFTLILVTEPR